MPAINRDHETIGNVCDPTTLCSQRIYAAVSLRGSVVNTLSSSVATNLPKQGTVPVSGQYVNTSASGIQAASISIMIWFTQKHNANISR